MLRFLLLAIALVPWAASAQSATKWRLIWSDEFNGPAGTPPNPAKWVYDLGAGGWGNRELERYTDQLQNASEDGEGRLVIQALKSGSGEITSARLKTQGRFAITYGKFSIRVKIPKGQGMWPAFWLLGSEIASADWPKCGEIDVMENIGKEPAIVHGTIHGPGYSGARAISAQTTLPNNRPLANDFHVYTIEWLPSVIRFYLDDQLYATDTPAKLPKGTSWVYNRPFFLLLNLAVGGSWPGNPDATTAFPQSMVVDWVRVWQAVE